MAAPMGPIDESLRDAMVLDRGGYPYLVHPLTDGVPRCDPALLREWTQWARTSPVLEGADLLLAPEAMALPLAVALSLEVDLPVLTVRKRRYDLPGETVAYCETGYGESCLHINDVRPGDRMVVVDDVLSTGGTLDALLGTLGEMDATVLGALVFLDKGGVRGTLEDRHNIPIHVMRTVRVEAGIVTTVE